MPLEALVVFACLLQLHSGVCLRMVVSQTICKQGYSSPPKHNTLHVPAASRCMAVGGHAFRGGGGPGGGGFQAPSVQQLTSLSTQFLPPGLVLVRPLQVSQPAAHQQLQLHQQQQEASPSHPPQSPPPSGASAQMQAQARAAAGGVKLSPQLSNLATAELVLTSEQLGALLAEVRAGAAARGASAATSGSTAAGGGGGDPGVDLLAAGLRKVTVVSGGAGVDGVCDCVTCCLLSHMDCLSAVMISSGVVPASVTTDLMLQGVSTSCLAHTLPIPLKQVVTSPASGAASAAWAPIRPAPGETPGERYLCVGICQSR
jgi:hypothetical protein